MEPSDQQLITQALNGSLQAWEALVRRHESRIYNFCLRLTGHADDALDLMQDVFVGVYRNLHSFRGESQFSSWAFRIAHNKAVDLVRRRRASPVLHMSDDRLPEPPCADRGPAEHMQTEQQNQHILQLLQQLNPEQRRVVELKVYQGLTFDEIAELEHISPNTAKTRFYAALKKLKDVLENSP